jgi:hypothetical protein
MVAVTALEQGDEDSALCWQNASAPMRYSKHWNILEEAAYQDISANLGPEMKNKVACSGGNLL